MKLIFGSLVFIPVFWIALGLTPGSASSLATETPYTLAVRASLSANANAQSLSEWESSGLTPRNIFEDLRNHSNSPAELCGALLALSPQDLALFENELESPLNQERIPCTEELWRKLQSHWNKFHASENGMRLSASPEQPTGPDAHRLPSLEKEIDPATSRSNISNGGLKNHEIAITLDDGPHPTRTHQILEIFKSWGIRATFFEVGFQAHARPEVSREVLSQGHSIGSHSWDHPSLPVLAQTDLPAAFSQIDRGRQAVEAAIGESFPFFRFPYGARNEVLLKHVTDQGLVSFLWNMDSLDWKLRDPAELLKRLTMILDQGQRGIILFHDIHEQDVLVMDSFLQMLKDRAYSTVIFVPKKVPALLP
ncbi:polysaccharide deacetylase family protein [Bdellovibrionota bacterium FG-2]